MAHAILAWHLPWRRHQKDRNAPFRTELPEILGKVCRSAQGMAAHAASGSPVLRACGN